jgi:hypothetical protein
MEEVAGYAVTKHLRIIGQNPKSKTKVILHKEANRIIPNQIGQLKVE